jgi:hypothetical protein
MFFNTKKLDLTPSGPLAHLSEREIVEKIFTKIQKIKNGYLVEVGAANGIYQSLSRDLIVKHDWQGLLIEGNLKLFNELSSLYKDNSQISLLHQWIYPGDFELTLKSKNIPKKFELLIIDIDCNDYYLWNVLHEFQPEVVIIEFNPCFGKEKALVVKYHPLNYWDGSEYFGASAKSIYDLAKQKGYQLISQPSKSINLVFVKERWAKRFKAMPLDQVNTQINWDYRSQHYSHPTYETDSQTTKEKIYTSGLTPLDLSKLKYSSGEIRKKIEYIKADKP